MLQHCFSDQYRTRDGGEVFTFHFQRQQEGNWFFSYARTPTSRIPDGQSFTVADERFNGETLEDLRRQAARFSELLHKTPLPGTGRDRNTLLIEHHTQ
jgi:hypothetical protein